MKKVMTGFIITSLAALLCFSLAGCSGSSSAVKVGETVSSDVMDFTLNRVDLSYYSYAGVSYNSSTGKVSNADGDSVLSLEHSIYSKDDGETWYTKSVTNFLLEAGSEVRFRTVGIAVFEPKDLSDSFKLKVDLLNSSKGKDSFTFTKE